jgi:hypothetical protein
MLTLAQAFTLSAIWVSTFPIKYLCVATQRGPKQSQQSKHSLAWWAPDSALCPFAFGTLKTKQYQLGRREK